MKDPIHPLQSGKLFDQFLINEIRAYLSYHQIELQMYYWRTERGEFERAKKFSKTQALYSVLEIST